MKLVITDCRTVTEGDIDLHVFDKFGDVTYYPLTTKAEVAARIADADIVLCNKTPMDADTLGRAAHLRYIGLFATGYNNVDLAYTNAHGITVCNAGGYSTDAVAQHVFALLLAHTCRVAEYRAFGKRRIGFRRSSTPRRSSAAKPWGCSDWAPSGVPLPASRRRLACG
jgi:glycerate dehydrogenase